MKQPQSRTVWTAILIVCAAVAAVCIAILIWLHVTQEQARRRLEEAASASPSQEMPADPASMAEDPEQPLDPSQIPVNFDDLRKINEDIYGWIDLTCTGQGYPILSNLTDPDRYLHLDINGNYSVAGSLYSQSTFNRDGFADTCTLIYGHDMRNGNMFGKLQRMAPQFDLDGDASDANCFTLYTPTKKEVYRICAAGVFSDQNVLYYYDFDDEAQFDQFFADLRNYPKGTPCFSADFEPQFGDKLAILSTCYAPDYSYRFLVVGVMIEKQGV